MKEYKFCRAKVTRADDITSYLNSWASDGWRVVSHAEAGGEYTFVLEREVRASGEREG